MSRIEDDVYITPRALADAAVGLLAGVQIHTILDLGAGSGVWGLAAAERFGWLPCITGVEVREGCRKPAGYTNWIVADAFDRHLDGILGMCSAPKVAGHPQAPAFDAVIGNPPYSLAEEFIERSLELVRPGGRVLLLLRASILASQGRVARLWRETPLTDSWNVSPRPSFTPDGKTDNNEYVICQWTKGAPITGRYVGGWLTWDNGKRRVQPADQQQLELVAS